jgi:hypothetical protein
MEEDNGTNRAVQICMGNASTSKFKGTLSPGILVTFPNS